METKRPQNHSRKEPFLWPHVGPGIYLFYNGLTGRLEELSQEEIKKYEEGETVHEAMKGW